MTAKVDCDLSAVFCDDIRHESNGKLILIGVYPEGLSVAAFPTQFVIAAWIKVSGLQDGEGTAKFRLSINDVQHAEGSVKYILGDANKPLNVFLVGLPISIDRPGKIALDLATEAGSAIGTAELDIMSQGDGLISSLGIHG